MSHVVYEVQAQTRLNLDRALATADRVAASSAPPIRIAQRDRYDDAGATFGITRGEGLEGAFGVWRLRSPRPELTRISVAWDEDLAPLPPSLTGMGPRALPGLRAYTRFCEAYARAIVAADPEATVRVGLLDDAIAPG